MQNGTTPVDDRTSGDRTGDDRTSGDRTHRSEQVAKATRRVRDSPPPLGAIQNVLALPKYTLREQPNGYQVQRRERRKVGVHVRAVTGPLRLG